jgi:DNA-binding NtrC family response regulator
MFAPGVVIYEKTSRWEAVLKRYFATHDLQVRPCRLPAQVLTTLAEMPGSVTVIDLAAGTAAGLRLIIQVRQQVPAGAVIVVAPESLADLEWPAREFGALAFLSESVTEGELGRLCARQLAPRETAGISRPVYTEVTR